MKSTLKVVTEERSVEGTVTKAEFCGHPSSGGSIYLGIQTTEGRYREASHFIKNMPDLRGSQEYIGMKVRLFFASNARGKVQPHRMELRVE
jgi:hypothetical protein